MTQVALHSSIVGGSTASRVIACPGSVALCAKMPPKPSSKYADEGTLLHDVMSDLLTGDKQPEDFLGRKYQNIELTQELIDEKIRPALQALNDLDPAGEMEVEVEAKVSYGDMIPGAFGSADLIGRLGDSTIILDWKFGDNVAVSAENNKQLLFYAAAARRTPETQWAFKGTKQLQLVIVQPPKANLWVTDFKTLDQFEADLVCAVKVSQGPDAPLAVGDHCRWCAAKPLCPRMTGAAERALTVKLKELPVEHIGKLLQQADLVEDWIKELRELAFTCLENDRPVPGYKLVAKRAVRSWVNDDKAATALVARGLAPWEVYEAKLISPAVAEKLLKKSKLALPDDLVVAVSSGNTLAPESDPRPAVLNLARQLTGALSKLV